MGMPPSTFRATTNCGPQNPERKGGDTDDVPSVRGGPGTGRVRADPGAGGHCGHCYPFASGPGHRQRVQQYRKQSLIRFI